MMVLQKRWMAYLVLLWVVLLPFEQAYAADPPSSAGEQTLERTRGIPEDFTRQGEAIRDEFLDDLQGVVDSPEDLIGEDIIVQVEDYQPKAIRSSLLEDSGIFVHALLSGTPTNPTVTIPRIRNIVIRNQKITTVPQGIPISIGRVTHISPTNRDLSYSNLGTIVIPIRQIPQEGKVPDEIIIDVSARIFFDVSEGLFFGPVRDILTEQSLDAWKLTREDHSFYAGYIQATEVKGDKASFMIYDNQLNELTQRPITLTVGQTSRSLSANRGGLISYGRLFDRYTLRLDSVKGVGDKVRLLVNRNGNVQTVYVTEGEDLFLGSPWFVESIATDVKGTSLEVMLRNKSNRQGASLKAKKLEVPQPPAPPAPPGQQQQENPVEKAKLEKLLAVEKIYLEKNKEAEPTDGVRDFDALVQQTIEFLLDQNGMTDAFKERALTLLKLVRNYWSQKRTEVMAILNLNPDETRRASLTDLQKKINDNLKDIEEVLSEYTSTTGNLPSSPATSNDPATLYRLAIAEYEKVIDNYPTVRDKAAAAHWKIANLALLPGVNDRQGASNHLEILLKNYKQEEYAPVPKKMIQDLLARVNDIDFDFRSAVAEVRETTTNDVIYVTLIGGETVPDKLKSKATIEVEGSPSKEYREGDQLLQDPTDELKWYVKEIKDAEVVLQEERTRQIEVISRNQQKQLNTGANKKRIVRLLNTDTKKEAHITIAPNTEAAFSEAVFSLHLPIEKRALDLPLFSDSFDEEIAKTEDLLVKLDKIIDNLGKVTEYWKKFCFITFAVVWVKNFFSGVLGGTGALARERTNEAFEKKYDHYRTLDGNHPNSCRNLSYDECVFKNQVEYDKMVDEADAAIGEINRGNYYDQQAFNLGPEYDDAKKELGYYGALANKDPANQAYRDRYYEIEARLARAQQEKEFSKKFFADGKVKSYEDVERDNGNPAQIVKTYEPQLLEQPGVKEQLQGKSEDEKNMFLWRVYSTRFLPAEREKQISEGMSKYFTKVNNDGTSIGRTTPTDNDYINRLKESYGFAAVGNLSLSEFNHYPAITVMEQGRQKGSVEFISIDAFHYVQVTYTTGGRASRYDLYKRSQPNGRMGGPSDVYLGVVDGQMLAQYKKAAKDGEIDAKLPQAIEKAQKCIGDINRKNAGGKYSRGEAVPLQSFDCGGLGAYVIETSATSVGPSCTEFMSPGDCKLLFNACDPVICPPSRCNLGGEWQVDNVIQTGIIGSAVLCLPNFGIGDIGKPGGVAMPVCLSGIYAGLQNIRSVIEGYRQCLITAKVSGRSVGICDRIRSFGICEILWKEGMAIFNTKKGLSRIIFDFFRGGDKSGGGEYSAFEQAVDNSVGSLQYFTQSYAKNTFALYQGAALPELGTEICKAAIFGKAPGLGNLFDQISKPESPPQFTAFFDEAPYSDLGNQPLSQYKITYHVYAGDNEDIMYTVYMQAADPYTGTFIIQPHVLRDSKGIIRNRRLPRGTFASESPDLILPAGMKEICVEINSRIYGRKVECGFGKVSTGFAINYISDQLTQSEAKKQINSAEACVPTSSPSITELGLRQGDLTNAGLGTVSSGFITTGIIRKCSKFNPGVGGDEDKWSPVGSCGEDDRERDLGTCWLYVPAAQNAIKEASARLDLNTSLAKTADEAVQQAQEQGKPIPGYYTLTPEQIKTKKEEAQAAINSNPSQFEAARSRYQEILGTALIDDETGAEIQYLMAKSYEQEALRLVNRQPATPTTPSQTPGTATVTRLSTTTINREQGGTLVITGQNFDPLSVVEMDGVLFDIRYSKWIDAQTVEFTIPQNAMVPGTYALRVVDSQGRRSNALQFQVTTEGTQQQQQTCTVQGFFAPQKYWGDEEGNELRTLRKNQLEMVTINLKVDNCEKNDIIIRILENDPGDYDDPVATIAQGDIEEKNNKIEAKWQTRYVDDSVLGLFGTDPEMIVAVYHRQRSSKAIFVGEQELSINEQITPPPRSQTQQMPVCNVNTLRWYNQVGQVAIQTTMAHEGDLVFIGFNAENCASKAISWKIIGYAPSSRENPQVIKSETIRPTNANEQIRIPIRITKPSALTERYEFKLNIEGVQQDIVSPPLQLI